MRKRRCSSLDSQRSGNMMALLERRRRRRRSKGALLKMRCGQIGTLPNLSVISLTMHLEQSNETNSSEILCS